MAIKFNFSDRVLSVVNDRRLTQREKVGHLNKMIKWENHSLEHLDALLRWVTGAKHIPNYIGSFDKETRCFRLAFTPKVYFEGGGAQFHSVLLAAMEARRWPYISFQGAGFWVGYFPHFERVEEGTPGAARELPVKPVVEQVLENHTDMAIKKPMKAKTVRRPKGTPKKAPQPYTIDPDQDEMDE